MPACSRPRADLNALLRGDVGSRLTVGWRAELIGEPIRRLVSGEAALAFDGKGGLVLEVRSGQPVPVHAVLPPIDWAAAEGAPASTSEADQPEADQPEGG